MADVSVTAANVRPGSTQGGATVQTVTAGETITAGMVCYKKDSDGEYYRGDADNSAETAGSEGLVIAISNAADGESMLVQSRGTYTVGGTVVVGEVYVLSATTGGIAPVSDGASGWYSSILGTGSSTTEINLNIDVTGYVRA